MATDIVQIQEEVNKQIATPEVLKALIDTTFKGLQPQVIKRAIMEGMMRGFKFNDFLEKNVYAIPFGSNYSLVTSIDYARKIGMRGGVVGKSAPQFEHDKDGNIISCTITIKRKVKGYVGEYTSTVYFKEYTTGRGLWLSKPHTMIAKVCEVQGLRMAVPEEMSQVYVEEEYQQGDVEVINVDVTYRKEIQELKTLDELKEYYLKNKGKGADFDKLIKEKKEQLESNDSTEEEKSEIIKKETI